MGCISMEKSLGRNEAGQSLRDASVATTPSHLFRKIYGPADSRVSRSSEGVGMEESRGTDQLRDIDLPIL